MKKTRFPKLIILLLINTLLIIGILILCSFLTENNKIKFIHSLLFIIPWSTLIVLLIFYSLQKNIKSIFSKVTIFAFILMIIFLFISYLNYQSVEIILSQGETHSLSDLYHLLSLKFNSNKIIKLEKFLIINNHYQEVKVKKYLSYIKVISKRTNYNYLIRVNKPLKIEKLKFYQDGPFTEIKNKKIVLNNALKITYNPYGNIMAIVSIIFLIVLGLDSWAFKK